MCACTEPVRTGIGAVCVEYGRPMWPITTLNHTNIPGTEKCLVFYFWHPMLVRPAMKRLFFLKAKNGLIITAAFLRLLLLLLHAAVDALYWCCALYDCCCCCCCFCCSVLLLYYQKKAEVLLLRTGGAHPTNIPCVAPFWTARFLCTYTHHRRLYWTEVVAVFLTP